MKGNWDRPVLREAIPLKSNTDNGAQRDFKPTLVECDWPPPLAPKVMVAFVLFGALEFVTT